MMLSVFKNQILGFVFPRKCVWFPTLNDVTKRAEGAVTMRVRRSRRTLYSLLAAVGLAAVVFLYCQIFSVRLMDEEHGQHLQAPEQVPIQQFQINAKPQENLGDEPIQKNVKSQEKAPVGSFKVFDKDKASVVKDKHLDKSVLIPNLEDLMPVLNFDYPRGVDKQLADKYTKDTSGMFTCLHSEEVIPFSEVNDDYCDCADGTDEPGTSACPHTRFFCTFQGTTLAVHNIPSSHVNDGICDCCDGSDEWKNLTLPDHVDLKDSQLHYGLRQAPCKNHCTQEVKLAQEDLIMHQKGAKIKQEYIREAKGKSNQDQLYGTDGEFYKLSQNCYEIKSDKYEYTVCPYKDIRQQAFPAPSSLIGEVPEWAETGPTNGRWVLRMGHGDPKQCPGHIARESLIYFECGLTDSVVSVQETEVCQYTIKFSTPAAC